MKIGIIEYIDSMHYLPRHKKCETPHGHTYKVEIIAEGNPTKGIIIDFAILRKKVKKVLRNFDHKNLNKIIRYPSCENLCLEIHKRLKEKLKYPLTIRIWEGQGKWVELSDAP